jgi:hypothetical protein
VLCVVVRNAGTGIKGPVGEWTKNHFASEVTTTNRVLYDPSVSWREQLENCRGKNIVFAMGFQRSALPTIEIISSKAPEDTQDSIIDKVQIDVTNCRYNKITGALIFDQDVVLSSSVCHSIFGNGIAFPQDYVNFEGICEPWVGFKRSIEETSLMIRDRYCESGGSL